MGQNLDKPKLLEKDQKFLSEITSLSEDEIIEWYNVFAMDSPDGKLGPEHIVEMYKDLFPEDENVAKYTELIMRAVDTDGDGAIDLHEFLDFIDEATNGTHKDRLRLLFDMYDKDHDGVVEFSEIVDVMKVFNDGKVQNAALKMLKKLDVNKDGKISEEEFLKAAENL